MTHIIARKLNQHRFIAVCRRRPPMADSAPRRDAECRQCLHIVESRGRRITAEMNRLVAELFTPKMLRQFEESVLLRGLDDRIAFVELMERGFEHRTRVYDAIEKGW